MFHPLPGVVDHRSVGAPVAESTLALALVLLTNGRSLFWEWQDSVLNSFNHFAWKLAWDKTQASKVLNVKVMIIFPDALQANCSSESSSQSNKYTKCHLTLVLSSAGFWVNRKGAQDTHLHCVVQSGFFLACVSTGFQVFGWGQKLRGEFTVHCVPQMLETVVFWTTSWPPGLPFALVCKSLIKAVTTQEHGDWLGVSWESLKSWRFSEISVPIPWGVQSALAECHCRSVWLWLQVLCCENITALSLAPFLLIW